MDNINQDNEKFLFANGQNHRDLRDNQSDGLQALRNDSDQDLERRIELPEVVARLEARLTHIKAVFRSQFSS